MQTTIRKLDATRDKMNAENITAEIVFGDYVTLLNKMLFEKHGIRLEELLNTRTFLDHNRIYQNT